MAKRYDDVIAGLGAAVFEGIGRELGDTKARPEHGTFTRAPVGDKLLDPVVDGGDILRADAKGSGLCGSAHDMRPGSNSAWR